MSVLASVDVAAAVGSIAVGYVLGSIPVAVLVARAHGFDPRGVGDRNPGYWNVKEQLGPAGSLPVFVGDVAKGAAAGAVGVLLAGSAWWLAYPAVAAAMIGHAYPGVRRVPGWPVGAHLRRRHGRGRRRCRRPSPSRRWCWSGW